MRTVSIIVLALFTLFFVCIGLTIPAQLPSQAAKDRDYYSQFRQAAVYIDKHKKMPDSAVRATAVRRRVILSIAPNIGPSLAISQSDCLPDFEKSKTDHFILSFWRGEWSECYAYPSGRTTLHLSTKAYLLSGLGVEIAIYWLLAILSGWGAARLAIPGLRVDLPTRLRSGPRSPKSRP